ncbi:MAG: site-2 protease family protein [Cyanobacteria bacterium]|nr:site-2 protease family protein [Cyanobacteriota bacterium]MDA0866896.1 site-2 protease family protein [Cyanobacteriota bacterium]
MVLLFLFSILSYLVVRHSVAGITRTPPWLLWLVFMAPVFTLVVWSTQQATSGAPPTSPPGAILALFILCPLLYWMLIQWGRITPKPETAATESSADATDAAKVSASKVALRPIDKEEEATLKNCFPWSLFYLQNIEYRPQALICKGQLRGYPTLAYDTIRDNIESHFGDRFLVIFQEGNKGKPFFALVPNPRSQKQPLKALVNLKNTRPAVALGLFVTTLFTTTWVGTSQIAGISESALQAEPMLFLRGLPYAITLMVILGIHELGHYLMARRYRIQSTLPYFIPIPFFLGTFGAFIQLRSPVPNRRALFDVGLAGPLAGFIITLPLLVWGLAHSEVIALGEEASMLNFQAMDPSASVALTLLSKLALGSRLTAENAIALHPVAVAGCLGLVVTALNLMPVGQLDGGHIVHAMYGQKTGAIVGHVSRFLVLGLVAVHPELLIWAILLFFISAVDEPALNDVSQLDTRRDLWGLAALTILILIVLPAPSVLTTLLL